MILQKFKNLIDIITNFLKKPLQFSWHLTNFDKHEIYLEKKFGKENLDNFFKIEIPDELMSDLDLYFRGCENICPQCIQVKSKSKISNNSEYDKVQKIFSFTNFKKIYGDIKSKKNKVLYDLCVYLKKNLNQKLNRPFIFVGLSMWETQPNAEEFGMNELHSDDFEPCHSKVLVYLHPLNEEYGSIQIEDKKFEFDRPSALWFKNTGVLHKAIPGKKFKRRAIGVTLMYTTEELSHDKIYRNILPHNYDDRHLNKPLLAYE